MATSSVEASVFGQAAFFARQLVESLFDDIVTVGFRNSLLKAGVVLQEADLKKLFKLDEIFRRGTSLGIQLLLSKGNLGHLYNPGLVGRHVTSGLAQIVFIDQAMKEHGLTLEEAVQDAQDKSQTLNYDPSYTGLGFYIAAPSLQRIPFEFTGATSQQTANLLSWLKNPLTTQTACILFCAILGCLTYIKAPTLPVFGVGLGFHVYPPDVILEIDDFLPSDFQLHNSGPLMQSLPLVDHMATQFLTNLLTTQVSTTTSTETNWFQFLITLRDWVGLGGEVNSWARVVRQQSEDQRNFWIDSTDGQAMCSKYRIARPNAEVDWARKLHRMLGFCGNDHNSFQNFLWQFVQWYMYICYDLHKDPYKSTEKIKQDLAHRFKVSMSKYSVPDYVILSQIKPPWQTYINPPKKSAIRGG